MFTCTFKLLESPQIEESFLHDPYSFTPFLLMLIETNAGSQPSPQFTTLVSSEFLSRMSTFFISYTWETGLYLIWYNLTSHEGMKRLWSHTKIFPNIWTYLWATAIMTHDRQMVTGEQVKLILVKIGAY